MDKFSAKTSVFFLLLIELLERFSYYGMRAILMLYAIDSMGLNMESDIAINYLGYFAMFSALLPLPLGILTDFKLKQKNAVLIGGFLALLGCLTLFYTNQIFVGIGLVFLYIGSGLVRLNLPILIGRLFEKTDRKRNLGFLGIYFMVNLGAALGSLFVGYVGETIGFHYGFGLVAAATFLYLLIFLFVKNRLHFREKNLSAFSKSENGILDYFEKKKHLNSLPAIALFLLFGIFASQISNIGHTPFYDWIPTEGTVRLFGFEIFRSFLHSFEFIWMVPITIVLGAIWIKTSVGSTLKNLTNAIFCLGIGTLSMSFLNLIPESNSVEFVFFTSFFFSIAEILLSTFETAFITRLADINYSSTILGSYWVLKYGCLSGIDYLLAFPNLESNILFWSALAFMIAATMFFMKKEILKITGGLD